MTELLKPIFAPCFHACDAVIDYIISAFVENIRRDDADDKQMANIDVGVILCNRSLALALEKQNTVEIQACGLDRSSSPFSQFV
jgi:hypothetical protein